jgi:hypothetical protein
VAGLADTAFVAAVGSSPADLGRMPKSAEECQLGVHRRLRLLPVIVVDVDDDATGLPAEDTVGSHPAGSFAAGPADSIAGSTWRRLSDCDEDDAMFLAIE